jgi:serine protease AprX
MDTHSKKIKVPRLISMVVALFLVINLAAVPATARSSTHSDTRSYIIQGTDADLVAALVEKHGGAVTSWLSIIRGVAADLSPQALSLLRSETAITAITPNAQVHLVSQGGPNIPATDYPDEIGADIIWGQGIVGNGVTVAIVDTGFAWHPGLFLNINGKLQNRVVGWVDFVNNRHLPYDPNGHGTHVAGIIANTQKGTDNEWDGIAPGVRLVGVRVLDELGTGTYERVIQGIQWVIVHKNTYNIRVMNLSLVASVQSPYWADPLNQAVMQAWAHGITVVVAAGNEGPEPMSIGVPGNNPYVITVGSFTDNYTPNSWNDDYITPFSASGPTLDGFVKPDIVAPGAHMVSTMMPWSYISRNHQANQITPLYFSMAGTSLSAGVVSGLCALIISNNPGLSPDQVKFRVTNTAFPWVDLVTTDALYSMWQQGAGRVNAPDAVTAVITGTANSGLDITADLAGTQHYEGFSYYDETTGQFRLRGDFGDWAGGYGTWSGGYGTWSGGYGTWSGSYGTWSGGYGTWSGGYGTWSGGYGTWSGGYGTWSGGSGTWSGGYGTWSGGYGTWSGNEPWAGTVYADPAFIMNFLTGVSPNTTTSLTSVNWVDEP